MRVALPQLIARPEQELRGVLGEVIMGQSTAGTRQNPDRLREWRRASSRSYLR